MGKLPLSKSWWQTLPGLLTAAAGIVTALSGLILAIHESGILPMRKNTSSLENTADGKPVVENSPFTKGTILKTESGSTLTLEKQLYAGTNATVFSAKVHSGDTVAVKLFWQGISPDSPSWERFRNEQQVAESLKHRNIIRILGTGINNGYPFTVMEYFRGRSLEEWIQTHDRIPGPDILSIATQTADAIDYAHSRGIVHRDIKPSNILIDSAPQGRVVLSDFGVARIFGAIQVQITAADDELVGSPAYLAPEAIQGQEITRSSDVYSFGVVLYEAIAGKDPFADLQVVSALLYHKTSKKAPDIRSFRKDVPESIARRLAQTLSRDPNQRPRTARAVLSGIENEIRGL
jgi:eukaryotic-like serine/threonine-protein kinase